MKFTNNFVLTMQNFSSINQNMYFEKGKIQSSVLFPSTNSKSLSLFARAKTDVDIESPFGVMDLSKFINAIKIFGKDIPEAHLTDTHINIGDGTRMISYQLTNPDFLRYEKNPDRLQVHDTNIEFSLSKERLAEITSIYSLFDLEYLSVRGKDGLATITVDNGGTNGSGGAITLGSCEEEFVATIKTKNLVLYKGMDYSLKVIRKGYVHFSNEVFEYFIMCDKANSIL